MGIFDAIANIWSTERTNEANRDNANNANDLAIQLARERNAAEIDLWNRQTAYNAPQAQMQRLEAAGLNPHLVYGQIAESKMSAPPSLDTANIVPARAEAAHISDTNPLAEYQQVKNLMQMNKLRAAETDAATAVSKTASAKSDYDVWKYNYMKDKGILDTDPIARSLGSKGYDILQTIGEWIGTTAGRIQAEGEGPKLKWQMVPKKAD